MLSNKHKYQYKIIFPLLTLITFSCNTVKYVSDDSFLLESNEIQIIDKEGGVYASNFLKNGDFSSI